MAHSLNKQNNIENIGEHNHVNAGYDFNLNTNLTNEALTEALVKLFSNQISEIISNLTPKMLILINITNFYPMVKAENKVL